MQKQLSATLRGDHSVRFLTNTPRLFACLTSSVDVATNTYIISVSSFTRYLCFIIQIAHILYKTHCYSCVKFGSNVGQIDTKFDQSGNFGQIFLLSEGVVPSLWSII